MKSKKTAIINSQMLSKSCSHLNGENTCKDVKNKCNLTVTSLDKHICYKMKSESELNSRPKPTVKRVTFKDSVEVYYFRKSKKHTSNHNMKTEMINEPLKDKDVYKPLFDKKDIKKRKWFHKIGLKTKGY